MATPVTIERVHSRARDLGFQCLDTTYVNAKSKMRMVCVASGHKLMQSWDQLRVKAHKGCYECRGVKVPGPKRPTFTEADIVDMITSIGGAFERLHAGRIFFTCRSGHPVNTDADTLAAASRKNSACCKQCRTRLLADRNVARAHTVSDVHVLMNKLGGKWIGGEYANLHSRLHLECAHGHAFTRSFNEVLNFHKWCPSCNRSGLYETYARRVFATLFNGHFFRSRKTLPSGYELDGYDCDLGLAFEYNGRQHYEPVPHFKVDEKELKEIQARDAIKRAECAELGIVLVEIHYRNNTFVKIKDAILEALRNTKFADVADVPHNWDEVARDVQRTPTSETDLMYYRLYAESRGGELVSTTLGGMYDPLEFKCAIPAHPTFKNTPSNIKGGSKEAWCGRCSGRGRISDDQMRALAQSMGAADVLIHRISKDSRTSRLITVTNTAGEQKELSEHGFIKALQTYHGFNTGSMNEMLTLLGL